MSGFIGPMLEQDFGGFDRPRALFSNMPVGISHLLDYKVYFDDFIKFQRQLNGAFTGTAVGTAADVAAAACAGGATPSAAQVDTAVDSLEVSTNLALKELQTLINAGYMYNVVKDTSATVLMDADAENGVLKLSSAGTTDDDGALIQNHETAFLVKSGKKLWFEARVKVSDADQCDMFVGLANEVATNPENVVAEGAARVGFELVDGSALIQCVQDNDTAATKTSSAVSAADDTFVRLGFRTDGGHIRFYVNRALVHSVAIDSAIAAVTMGPAFYGLSGNATGTHTRSIDYFLAVQER